MLAHGIAAIDLLVVNLYPFEATLAAGKPAAECIEPPAGREGDGAVMGVEVGQHRSVIGDVDHHGDVLVVLGSRPRPRPRPSGRSAARWPRACATARTRT
jgi:phosphoribosylaminoimidazolecarboxamide formyltransferase/IMP cyclohydrolase